MVTSTNNNVTYHLPELDGMRIAVPMVGKRIKAFKKRHEAEPDSDLEDEARTMDKDQIDDGLRKDE